MHIYLKNAREKAYTWGTTGVTMGKWSGAAGKNR